MFIIHATEQVICTPRKEINKIESQFLDDLLFFGCASGLSTNIRPGPETPLLDGGSFASKRERADIAFVFAGCDDDESFAEFPPEELDVPFIVPLCFEGAPLLDAASTLPFFLAAATELGCESRTKARPLPVVLTGPCAACVRLEDTLCLERAPSAERLELTLFRFKDDSGGESGIPNCCASVISSSFCSAFKEDGGIGSPNGAMLAFPGPMELESKSSLELLEGLADTRTRLSGLGLTGEYACIIRWASGFATGNVLAGGCAKGLFSSMIGGDSEGVCEEEWVSLSSRLDESWNFGTENGARN